MPLDIRNAEQAWLTGTTKFEEWKEKFETRWYAPLGERLVRTMIASLPAEVRKQLDQRVLKLIEKGGGNG